MRGGRFGIRTLFPEYVYESGALRMDESGTPMHPCVRCATMQKTCCEVASILVTQGDVARIAAHTGRADFWEARHPTERRVLEFDADDANWIRYTVGPNGRRR